MAKALFGFRATFALGALVLFLILIHVVTGEHIINSGSSIINVNQSAISLINISIYNNDSGNDANITGLNITLLNETVLFLSNSNGTDTNNSFSNTSNVLTWVNASAYLIGINETKYFWFNINATSIGNYNIAITRLNATGAYSTNITINVSDLAAPSITNVINRTITGSSAIINWTTNENANSIIYYGESQSNLSSSLANYSNVTSRQLTITGLKSSTRYYYNVTSCDVYNNCANSSIYNFTTSSYVVSTTFNFNEETSYVFNISINNTESSADMNITEVNITLHSNITFTASSNGTNAIGIFNSTSTILSWHNDGLVMNLSNNNFWFTASVAIPGNYSINVSVTNRYGIGVSNLSVNVNDINVPVIDGNSLSNSNPDTDSTTITWTTDENSNSTVYYDIASNPNSADDVASSNSMTTSHSVPLSGLSAGTRYYYEVRSCDVYNHCSAISNEDNYFDTDPDSDGGTGGSGTTGDTTDDFWDTPISYSSKEFSEYGSINRTLSAGERIRIKINGKTYYIGVIRVRSSSVTINVSATSTSSSSMKPIQATVTTTSPQTFDVTNDTYSDIKITLIRVVNSTHVNLNMSYVFESVNATLNTTNTTSTSVNNTSGGSNNSTILEEESEEEEPGSGKWIIILVIIVVIVLLGGGIAYFVLSGKLNNVVNKESKVKVKSP